MKLINYLRGREGLIVRKEISKKNSDVISECMPYVDRITQDLGIALPHGWKLRIETSGLNLPDDFNFLLQSDIEGGSFADVKIETLRKFPELIATGLTPDVILDLMESCLSKQEHNELYGKLSPYKGCPILPKEIECYLRDTYNITGYAGGISLKAQLFTPRRSSSEFAEILVAFSGGTAEQDSFFAAHCVDKFITAYRHADPSSYLQLHTSQFRQNPCAASFYLSLCGLL